MNYFQILGILVLHNYVADSISPHYTQKVVNKDDLKIDNYYYHKNIHILLLCLISHIFSLFFRNIKYLKSQSA